MTPKSTRTLCLAILSVFWTMCAFAQDAELVTLHDSTTFLRVQIPADYQLIEAEQGPYVRVAAANPRDPYQRIYCLAYNMKTSDFDYGEFIKSCRGNFFPDSREVSLGQLKGSFWQDVRKTAGVYHNEQSGLYTKAIFLKSKSYAYLMFASARSDDFGHLDASFASLGSTMTFLDHIQNILGTFVRVVIVMVLTIVAIGLGTYLPSRFGYATRRRKWILYLMIVLCVGTMAAMRWHFDLAWWKSILFPSVVLIFFLAGRAGRISYVIPDYS